MTKRILNEKEYWNMSYIKRVTIKIRSASSPLIIGTVRKWGICGHLVGVGLIFWGRIFGSRVQRRGVNVNIPKNGSRAGEFCFGGI
jgi:hypothetical protein